MNRRAFLKNLSSVAGGAVGIQLSLHGLVRAGGQEDANRWLERDPYGGCPAIRFEATGFFHLRKEERWWFVTPDGNAFLSLGLNHAHSDWLSQEYNRAYWTEQFGATPEAIEDWEAGFRVKVLSDLEAFGFNTLGGHNDFSKLQPGPPIPWIQSISFIDTHHWKEPESMHFPDVFSESFEAHCQALALEHAAPFKDRTFLLGYAMSDCPILTEIDAAPRPDHLYGSQRGSTSTWPLILRNLPGDQTGKQVYVGLMKQRYAESIASFNQAYRTPFSSWNGLLQASDWRRELDPANVRELKDNRAFLNRIVDQYYQVATQSIRAQDSNHLIFGDKLNGNTDAADTVIEITSKYTDLVFYQMYGRWSEQRPLLARWSDRIDKPFFNGDGTFSVPNDNMPNPHGPHAIDQEHRAEMMVEFAEGAFARPDFLGWNVCGWVDTWKSMPRKSTKQHSGIQDPFGIIYAPVQRALNGFSQRLYEVAAP